VSERHLYPAYYRTAAILGVVLTLGAFPARAQFAPIWLIAERILGSSQPSGGVARPSGINAEYVSWTLPAGPQYTDVVVNADVAGVGGVGTGTAYLYRAAGTSSTLTSAATLVASNAVTVTGNVTGSTTMLFSNLTLSAATGPVTYYVVLVPSNAFLTWYTSDTGISHSGVGATVNLDQGAAAAVASPPSGSTWTPLPPNGLLFEVFTLTQPSAVPTVPTLSGFGLLGAAVLLGLSGWLVAKRRSAGSFVVLLLILCAIALPCSAATINIGPTRVITTIQGGVDAASPGDTVRPDVGVYPETVVVNKTLSILGIPLAGFRGANFIVNGGTLTLVTFNRTNNATVNAGATLDGGAEMGAIRVQAGGTLTGGFQVFDGVAFSPGSTFKLVLTFFAGMGTLPVGCANCTSLDSAGTVDLTGSPNLAVTISADSAPFPSGYSFPIIPGPVTGTFAGLPNNAILTAGGVTFRITYGSVTLTTIPAPPVPALPRGGLWALAAALAAVALTVNRRRTGVE